MSKRFRIQFGLRPLMISFVVVVIGILVTQRLRTDTIIHFEKSCTLQLPDGQRVQTNRWFRLKPSQEWNFLCTDIESEFLLCDSSDTKKIALIQHNGEEYQAVVVDFRIEGPKYLGEYWIRFGDRLDSKIKTK